MITKSFEEFRSPVDGTMITSRKDLREHNARHDVTNTADYSKDYIHAQQTKKIRDTKRSTDETRQYDITRFAHELKDIATRYDHQMRRNWIQYDPGCVFLQI